MHQTEWPSAVCTGELTASLMSYSGAGLRFDICDSA